MSGTEGRALATKFTDAGIREIARLATEINRTVENIGARRLHTVIERIMETISFEAADLEPGTEIKVDATDVQAKVGDMLKRADLSKFIL